MAAYKKNISVLLCFTRKAIKQILIKFFKILFIKNVIIIIFNDCSLMERTIFNTTLIRNA